MNIWMTWKRAFSLASAITGAPKPKTSWIDITLSHRKFFRLRRTFSTSCKVEIKHPKEAMSATNSHANLSTTKVDTDASAMSNGNSSNIPGKNSPEFAIIRYSLGDERFEFKLTLRNGKIFNFDRSTADPLQAFIDRMVANVTKKIKTFDGNVAFLESLRTDNSPHNDSWETVSNTLPLEDLLKQLLKGSKRLNVQIGQELYDVAVNPPEIYAVKFFKTLSVDFPTLPVKIETSSNFQKDKSQYIWEYALEPETKSLKMDNKPKKNKANVGAKRAGNCIWKDTGCRSLVFTPGKDLLGSVVRFTCKPSDGNGFGVPFSVELPSAVGPSLVKDPLYLERLSRMNSKSIPKRDDLNFFRVVSYNCLADTYATEEWFVSSPKGCLGPDFRLPFLTKELEAYGADLYCLQEVDQNYFEGFFTPFFDCKLNYKGLFSCKVGQTNEGVATFYNPAKVDLIRNETVVILEHMKSQSFWESVSSLSDEFLARLVDRNTVLQVSIFRTKACPNTILIVANTHLYFHPDADHIRCLQTITCVDYIERTIKEIRKTFPNIRVALMFCGDFNCTPPFSSYRFLSTGKIETDDEDWTSHSEQKLIPGIGRKHSLNIKSAHPGEGLTNITSNFEGCIDYVMYQPEHFELLDAYPTPDKSVIASIIGVDEIRKVSLPNFNTPSDHLPLMADFLLRSE